MPRRGGRRLSGGAGGGGGRVHPGHVLSHARVQATMHNWGQVSLAMSTLGPEVKFVNAVRAGGSVKFLPAV